MLEALTCQTHDGWLIPSTSHAGHSYYVASAKDTCQCSLHCRLCDCCPYMYGCSCLDYAVHATVCKHMHTFHQLRQQQDGNAVDNCLLVLPHARLFYLLLSILWHFLYSYVSKRVDKPSTLFEGGGRRPLPRVSRWVAEDRAALFWEYASHYHTNLSHV